MNVRSYSCCAPNKNEFKRIDKLSSILKLVGENNRLQILCILKQGEHCVCEVNEHITTTSQSLISHHLKDLKEAGLVENEKRGLRVYYSLTKKGEQITNLLFQIPMKEVPNL